MDIENNKQTTTNEKIEQYLSSQYNFRYNLIKSRVEYKKINSTTHFKAAKKIDINSFRRELYSKHGINTTSENIRCILESDFSEKIHPIQDYFNKLPKVNPEIKNGIQELAKTVQVKNSEKWEEYLTKWLVGVVANAINDDGCQNHTCLVLTGEQGKFKTTWLDNLCPKPLKSYLYTGKIDPQNKDVQTLLAEYFLINIDDQLIELNKKDENQLKSLITTPSVKYRRPYDIYIEEYPHLASFMASVNGTDFLTDPSGSRRFLPFQVISIDINKTLSINIDLVYSEVLWLLNKRFRYWFDDNEINELHQQNSMFQVQSREFEVLMQAFQKPETKDKSEYFMTTSQIINYLNSCTNLKFNEKKMGEALRKAGFERIQKKVSEKNYSIYGYSIQQIEPNPFTKAE